MSNFTQMTPYYIKMSDSESSCEPTPCKNAFVQRVIADFANYSPEMKVRDLEQPSHGSLKRQERSIPSSTLCTLRDKAQVVLVCKSLRNEELRPTSACEVNLSAVITSSLMQKRRALKSLS